jgi:hypothetical protein
MAKVQISTSQGLTFYLSSSPKTHLYFKIVNNNAFFFFNETTIKCLGIGWLLFSAQIYDILSCSYSKSYILQI